jgi:hypothetical protein
MTTVGDVALDASRLVEEARSFLGRTPGPTRVGRDPVNLPMVHHWCQALGDRNPAYLDEDFAATTRGHLIAPPGMLQTWIMDAPRDPARRGAHVSIRHPEADRLMQALIERKVIPDFRAPDSIRLGLSPLTTSFEDVQALAAAGKATNVDGSAWGRSGPVPNCPIISKDRPGVVAIPQPN